VAITETIEEYGDVDGHGGDRILETETLQGRGKKAEAEYALCSLPLLCLR
jgi:hypothetical protein